MVSVSSEATRLRLSKYELICHLATGGMAGSQARWNRSRVTSVDWASYPILKFPEVPEIVMELINRPNDPPWGVGEPAACLPPPAISNAVFDAVGVRLRSVPFTSAKLMAAMKGTTAKA